jgi:amidohydrolase
MIGINKRTMLAVFIIIIFSTSLVVLSAASQEKSLDVLPEESNEISALRKAVDEKIDELSKRLIEMSDWMYYHPESGFLEFKASAMLSEELKKHGFEVEMGVPGLDAEFDKLKIIGGLPADYSGPSGIPTAFKARYKGKTEHPVIGFIVEYDALRGNPQFHGCQHNMQGPTGIGAAIALAKVMEEHNIPGSIWVIGTPAEEVGPPTKAAMAKTGYLNGVDFILRSHGTAHETLHYPGGFSARNIRQMKYTFHGKSAHAQSAWQGKSALDAVLLLFHAMDMIREHSEPQFRFHGIISDAGVAPNIVPELASAVIWIRHIIDETPTGFVSPKKAKEMIEDKVAHLDNMAKGAALATGTTVDIDHYGEYIPGISVGVLNDIAFHYAVSYGGLNIEERKVPNQWEETGFVTLLIPGVHVSIGTEGIPEVAGHSQENADITISPEGHKSLILTAKVMGATALRLIMDKGLQKKAKAEHAMWLKKYNDDVQE